MGFWGFVGDHIGRRLAIIIPAVIGCFIAPLYLNTADLTWITIGFALQAAFAGAIYGLQPADLTERFPTEVWRHRERVVLSLRHHSRRPGATGRHLSCRGLGFRNRGSTARSSAPWLRSSP